MNSTSQNFPRTFYKLTKTWDLKTGNRTSQDAIWTTTSTSKNDPISMIPAIMSIKFGEITDMLGAFTEINGLIVQGDQVWIYNMRKSDVLPKSPTDLERIYAFVGAAVRRWFNIDEGDYLIKHIHITASFFVWYFTKPNFFHKDKIMKQTTRNGIQRVWSPFFLEKEPKTTSTNHTTRAIEPKRQPMTTTDALLPKQLTEQEKIKKNINKIISDSDMNEINWEDSRTLHISISEAIADEERKLSIKQTKKLQNLYNDYTKITSKINETNRKRAKVELANSKIAIEPVIDDELGPPPDEPPKLTRQLAQFEDEECVGCIQNQPNQSAHIGGCLPDPIDDLIEAEDDDVPDSWEDL